MRDNSDIPYTWNGKKLKAVIMYSQAGISQHILIQWDTGAFLFDSGDGILRDAISAGVKGDDIEAIFYTHGHFDHMGGLHSLLGLMRMTGRRKELYLYAPRECLEVISVAENFIKLYQATIPFRISLERANPGENYEFAGTAVRPFPVVHCGSIEGKAILDPVPALGYKITRGGESIVISGDTGDCGSLRDNVRGADLAIIEATFKTSREASDEELKKVHLSEDLASHIGGTAKEYVLVHKGRRV
jgi:ribonuclease Z